MAQLRVGDILIENGSVTFTNNNSADGGLVIRNSSNITTTPPRTSSPKQNTSDVLTSIYDGLDIVPIGGNALLAAGGIMIAFIGILLIVYGGPTSMIQFLTRGIPFLPIGISLLIAGMLKNRSKSRKKHMDSTLGVPQEVIDQRLQKLRPYLIEREESNTIENLVRSSGLTEDAVTKTLYYAKESNLVLEDVSMDTGEWFYYLQNDSVGSPEPRHLSLEDRIARKE